MARLRPFVEREAMWAAGLASLAAISFWATLPAAVILAVRTIRREDHGQDGSESAFAALALALALLAFWFTMPPMYAIVRTARFADDLWRVLAFAGGLVLIAAIVVVLSTYHLRCHPERWIARRLATAGLAAAVLAGGLQAALALSRSGGFLPSCGRETASNADCVGVVPWSAVLPAIVTAGALFAISVTATGVRHWLRTARPSMPPRPDPRPPS